MKKINKKRIIPIDMARAIATLAVMLIHISAFTMAFNNGRLQSKSYILSLIINEMSRFSVPLFILISGIGLSLTYKKEKGYSYFIKGRLLKIIPLYLIWCLIYILTIKKGLGIKKSLEYIRDGEIFYHLYFIPLIVKFYIIFLLLNKFLKRKAGLIVAFLVTSAILISVHYYNIPNVRVPFFFKRNSLYWFFYFAVGVYIAPKINFYIDLLIRNKKKVIVIFMLCTLGIIYEGIYSLNTGKSLDYATTFLRPSVILYSLSTSAFLASIKWKNNLTTKILSYIADNSFIMYLSHPFVLYYYLYFYKSKGWFLGSIYFEMSAFAVCIACSLVISKLFKLKPYINKM